MSIRGGLQLSEQCSLTVCVFISLKVKPMDKEGEKADSEEKEKGIAFALLECVGVFSGGLVSILFVLETKHVIKNIQWTKAKNFTVERGRQQIEELISVSHSSIHSGRPQLLTVISMKN